MADLFGSEPDPRDEEPPPTAPLADRMRPRATAELVGQAHLLGKGHVLETRPGRGPVAEPDPVGAARQRQDHPRAADRARRRSLRFVPFSAVLSGVKEVRAIMQEAKDLLARSGRRTLLFVDEIHRFNKAQQDAFLPFVERGDILLIGATTENPSFELNSALLSRARTLVLEPLGARGPGRAHLRRAVADPERGLGRTHRGLGRGAAGPRQRGRRRRAAGAQPARDRGPRCSRTAGRSTSDVLERGAPAQDAALRQVGRGALQPDLGPAQERAQLGPRRDRLLADAHARLGRGPAATSRAGSSGWRSRTSGSRTRSPCA